MATAVKETWTVPAKDAELVAAVRTALASVKPAVTYDKAAAEKHLAALKEVSFFDGVGNEFHFKGRLSKYATFFGKHIMAGLSMSDAIDAAIANEINSRSEKTTNDLIDTPIVPGDLATFPKAKEPRDTEETPARSNGSTPSAGEGDQVVETEETPAQVPEVAGNLASSPKVAMKMAQIMGEITKIGKTEKHSQGWRYATYDDFLEAIRPMMAQHNLALIPEVISSEVKEIPVKNNKANRADITMRFNFVCGDTGQVLTSIWRSEAIDYGDKAITKAVSLGTKYFLRATFMISTGEDVDPDKG